MTNLNRFTHLDNHVRKAWLSKTFTDGTKINLNSETKEQGFIVKSDGIFEVQVQSQRIHKCKDGREIIASTFNPNAFMGHAGGHTHPREAEQKPGPLDGNIAKRLFTYGKLSYVITYKGAYAVEWTGQSYVVRNLVGKQLSEKKIKKLVKKWGQNKPRKPAQTERDFVCQ